MKFTAKTTDTGHIESFTRIVAMVTRLTKQCALRIVSDRLCFIRPGSLRSDGGNKLHFEVVPVNYFEDYRMEGWSKDEDEIFLEIMPDELYQALRSAVHASEVKLKLTKKNNSPYLTVEIKLPASRTVTHDVPITIIPPRQWTDLGEPEFPNFNVSLFFPNVKTVQRIVTAMKSMSGHLTISANRQGGDMKFHIRTDPAEVTSYFKELRYAEWSDEDSQAPTSQRSQLSGRRVTERAIADDNAPGRNGDNNEDKLYSARVDIKTLAQFLSSQQSTHYSLIMNIVDRKMIHFCAVTDDLRFQYFLPAVDE